MSCFYDLLLVIGYRLSSYSWLYSLVLPDHSAASHELSSRYPGGVRRATATPTDKPNKRAEARFSTESRSASDSSGLAAPGDTRQTHQTGTEQPGGRGDRNLGQLIGGIDIHLTTELRLRRGKRATAIERWQRRH